MRHGGCHPAARRGAGESTGATEVGRYAGYVGGVRGIWNLCVTWAETGPSLRLRKFCARIAKAVIQAVVDRSPHAALLTKVGCAQEADFAKFGSRLTFCITHPRCGPSEGKVTAIAKPVGLRLEASERSSANTKMPPLLIALNNLTVIRE